MGLSGGVVVVGVHLSKKPYIFDSRVVPQPLCRDLLYLLHDPLPVVPGKLQCEVHPADVAAAFLAVHGQVGKIEMARHL